MELNAIFTGDCQHIKQTKVEHEKLNETNFPPLSGDTSSVRNE